MPWEGPRQQQGVIRNSSGSISIYTRLGNILVLSASVRIQWRPESGPVVYSTCWHIIIQMMEKLSDQILHLSFNSDYSYLSVGSERGFKVYRLNPMGLIFSRDFGAGIGIAELVERSNIIAIVGGGNTPRYPLNKVMIWDQTIMKSIIETNCKTQVKGVRMRPDRCIIVLETKIFVFNLSDFKLLDVLQSLPNPKGLCAVASGTDQLIIAYPSKKVGYVDVQFYEKSIKTKIQAHKSVLSALQLTPSGQVIATASQKGTLIRIFDTQTGFCTQQLRRGSEYATIYSIAFDLQSKWVACSSDSGTIHIFSLKNGKNNQSKNARSKLKFFGFINNYFHSEWSFAQFKVSDTRTKVGFMKDKPNTVMVASTDGRLYNIEFSVEKGGDCVLKKTYNLNDEGKQIQWSQ